MKKSLMFIILCCLATLSHSQKLILTAEGMRSAEDEGSAVVIYQSKELDQEELYDYCVKELGGIPYLPYSFDKVQDERITLYGYFDSVKFLVFGQTSIRFIMNFEFDDDAVRVNVDLTKANGNEINFGRLFSKKGNARLSAPKNKLEDEVNTLIKQIFGKVVIINP